VQADNLVSRNIWIAPPLDDFLHPVRHYETALNPDKNCFILLGFTSHPLRPIKLIDRNGQELLYDDDGNLLDDGSKVYEWDIFN
jgi:hypothetical protein